MVRQGEGVSVQVVLVVRVELLDERMGNSGQRLGIIEAIRPLNAGQIASRVVSGMVVW